MPASVLRPIPDLIRILRDEIFVTGGPLSPLAHGDSLTLMQADPARVRIINNSYSVGREERTARFLTAQDMQVVEYGADRHAGVDHTLPDALDWNLLCHPRCHSIY